MSESILVQRKPLYVEEEISHLPGATEANTGVKKVPDVVVRVAINGVLAMLHGWLAGQHAV